MHKLKEFDDFGEVDQKRMTMIAQDWLIHHLEHVSKLIESAEKAYPPSGYDCFKPELWKGAHWKWFVTL